MLIFNLILTYLLNKNIMITEEEKAKRRSSIDIAKGSCELEEMYLSDGVVRRIHSTEI